jgi:uncharacterized protein (DUF3084 family)
MEKQMTLSPIQKGIAMAVSTGTLVSMIAGAIFWVNSNMVFASDYATDQLQRQQVDVQIMLEMLYDRAERADTQEKKKEIERRIKRLEKQQEEIDKRLLEKK